MAYELGAQRTPIPSPEYGDDDPKRNCPPADLAGGGVLVASDSVRCWA